MLCSTKKHSCITCYNSGLILTLNVQWAAILSFYPEDLACYLCLTIQQSIYEVTFDYQHREDWRFIMGYKTLFFGLFCILFAHYIYMPIPENIEESWKVRMIDAVMKITSLLVIFFHSKLGSLATNIYIWSFL